MAPWPFNSSSSSPSSPPHHVSPSHNGTLRQAPVETLWTRLTTSFNDAPAGLNVVIPTVVSTITILGFVRLYGTYLRRIPTTAHIKPNAYRTRTLFGRVTSVGDGDNFHLFHTPGGRLAGWGWLRGIPSTRAKLKNQTIPIRIAGIDAPEGAHFGRPAQPLASEALAWLASYVLHRPVRAHIHKKDQYDRVVATVYVRRYLLFRKDVGLEMLRCGLATTYEAKTGAEFGGKEEVYKAAETTAKARRRGVWGRKMQKNWESPREYKARMKGEDNKEDAV